MVLCWKWSGPASLLLLVLYEVTGQGDYNTTINIESMISQRDSLQAESDRLRVAVIILGIFFALASLFIIIVGIYIFLKRRSGTLKRENCAQLTTSPEQNTRQQHLPKSQNKDNTANQKAKNKTGKQVKQQEKEIANRHSTSTSRTSGDYEEQSTSPNTTLPKRSSVALETNKGSYANTKANQDQSNDRADPDEREVYIDPDDDKRNESDARKSTIASRSDEQISSEQIYENYTPEAARVNYTPEAAESYSELDTETPYDHHYE